MDHTITGVIFLSWVISGLYKKLSFAGIKLVALAEGEVNELHVGLKGTMNALFLKDLAQKTHRGLEGRVRQGKSGGGAIQIKSPRSIWWISPW